MRQSPKIVGVWMLRTFTVSSGGPWLLLMTHRRCHAPTSQLGTGCSAMTYSSVAALMRLGLLRVVEQEGIVRGIRVLRRGRLAGRGRIEDARGLRDFHRRDGRRGVA